MGVAELLLVFDSLCGAILRITECVLAYYYGMYFVSKFNGLNSMQKTEITKSVTDPRSVY